MKMHVLITRVLVMMQEARLDIILPKDQVRRTKEDANFSGIKQPASVKKYVSSIVTKKNSKTELASA
jgi:hypothetical protein